MRHIAVDSPADCVETLKEIDGAIREAFEHSGGERFTYISCLNDGAPHIAALIMSIEEHLGGRLPARGRRHDSLPQ